MREGATSRPVAQGDAPRATREPGASADVVSQRTEIALPGRWQRGGWSLKEWAVVRGPQNYFKGIDFDGALAARIGRRRLLRIRALENRTRKSK